MKTPGAHAHEDRLLDFAYDELPHSEAQAVERHLQGCPRCTETLQGIRGVRRSMARLPTEAEPSAGLDSLLAYAQQSARRAAAGAEPPARWWRRLLAPAAGAVAVSVLGVVVLRVNQDVDLRPSLQSATAVEPASLARPQPATAAPVAAMPSAAPAPSTPMAQAETAPAPAPAAKPSRLALDERSDKNSDENAKESSRLGLSLKAQSMPSLAARGGVAKDDLGALSINSALEGSSAASPERKREQARDASALADADAVYDQASAPGALARARRSSPATTASQPNAAPPPAPPPASPPTMADSAPVAAEASREEALSEPASVGAASGGALSKAAAPEPLAQRVSPSPEELMRQADLALRSGDRAREVLFLRAALDGGAHGSQALDALSRLCEAESALGRQHSAIEVCKRVVATAPDSSAARSARRLLEGMLQPSSTGSEAESR